EVIEAATGLKLNGNDVRKIGERIINIERAFLIREGIRKEHDTLPKRFLEEPIPSGISKGSIFELEKMLNEYYEERKWSKKTGIPLKEKLKELNLENVIEQFEKIGIEME
ncbi:MAG: aldehyde ferredoxin oxidoreductase C-terminal domain-containing protein, partial [Nitrososphaerota archaeon]